MSIPDIILIVAQVWFGGFIWGFMDDWRDHHTDSWVATRIPEWAALWFAGGFSIWESYADFKGERLRDVPKWLTYKPGGFIRWLWCSDYWHGLKNLYLLNLFILIARLIVMVVGPWGWLSLPTLMFVEGALAFVPTYNGWLERKWIEMADEPPEDGIGHKVYPPEKEPKDPVV